MITFVYAIGGTDINYYNSLIQSLISLAEVIKYPYKVVIISDINLHSWECNESYRYYGKTLSANAGKHEFWRMRYDLLSHIDTEYVMYLDVDTVFVNDNISSIIEKIGDSFGICQHFWVPTILSYYEKAMPKDDITREMFRKLNITKNYEYFASGAFIFKNNATNAALIKEVQNTYNAIYGDSHEYLEGFTDEFWLAYSIWKTNTKVCKLSGAFNHCAEPPMLLRDNDGILEGSNPQKEDWAPVTLFHCATNKRVPGWQYDQDLAKKVKECFPNIL